MENRDILALVIAGAITIVFLAISGAALYGVALALGGFFA